MGAVCSADSHRRLGSSYPGPGSWQLFHEPIRVTRWRASDVGTDQHAGVDAASVGGTDHAGAHTVTDQDAEAGQRTTANTDADPAMQRSDAGAVSAAHATPDVSARPDADTVSDIGTLRDAGCVRQAATAMLQGVML